MASAPPLPSELHRVIITLDGSKLTGTAKQRKARYFRYMKKVRAVAKMHGAKVTRKEILLKQSVITARKRSMK